MQAPHPPPASPPDLTTLLLPASAHFLFPKPRPPRASRRARSLHPPLPVTRTTRWPFISTPLPLRRCSSTSAGAPTPIPCAPPPHPHRAHPPSVPPYATQWPSGDLANRSFSVPSSISYPSSPTLVPVLALHHRRQTLRKTIIPLCPTIRVSPSSHRLHAPRIAVPPRSRSNATPRPGQTCPQTDPPAASSPLPWSLPYVPRAR
jgi:hypothetical protein